MKKLLLLTGILCLMLFCGCSKSDNDGSTEKSNAGTITAVIDMPEAWSISVDASSLYGNIPDGAITVSPQSGNAGKNTITIKINSFEIGDGYQCYFSINGQYC